MATGPGTGCSARRASSAPRKLAGSSQEAACRGRLVTRYLAMASYFDEHFLGDDQLARYWELRREHASIRAALEFSLGRGEARPAPRSRSG